MHAIIDIQILMLNLIDSTHSVIITLYNDAGPVPAPEQLGPVVGAIMNQHGWNLLWFGIFRYGRGGSVELA